MDFRFKVLLVPIFSKVINNKEKTPICSVHCVGSEKKIDLVESGERKSVY